MADKKIKVGLNGFGRIGRVFFRLAWDNPDFEIAVVNSRSGVSQYAHLLKYDSIYGIWDKEISSNGDKLYVEGKPVLFSSEINGGKYVWEDEGIDLVVDCSGKYKKRDLVKNHLDSGAGMVMNTYPMDDPDITLVMGINEKEFDVGKHRIVSAASCTSVCSALTLKVLEEKFGVKHGMITTVHAITSNQNIHDGSHDDPRRGRSAVESIIPTTTGVTKTINKLFPQLDGKVSGISLRVPIVVPSLVTIAAEMGKETTADEINSAFRAAAEGELKGHLAASDLPLVSIDYKQNPNGAIIDLLSTSVTDGRLANILSWYDNEWGYTSQAVALAQHLARKLKQS